MKIEHVRRLKTLLDVLTYFIQERESIRRKRALGLPPPWTDDEILGKYRFTNVRRMDDRVSLWLLNNWYRPFKDHPNMLAAVALARFVNRPESLSAITSYVFTTKGPPKWGWIKDALREIRNRGETIFNAAYMVRGNNGIDKIESVVDFNVLSLYETSKGVGLIHSNSMEQTHGLISSQFGFGSFMAGQVVADLRWAWTGKWKDKKKWAPIGPGSRRGMNRIQGRDPDAPLNQEQFQTELREMMARLQSTLPRDLTRRLEAMDYQNWLCELSKYLRALTGQGKPKQLYRARG